MPRRHSFKIKSLGMVVIVSLGTVVAASAAQAAINACPIEIREADLFARKVRQSVKKATYAHVKCGPNIQLLQLSTPVPLCTTFSATTRLRLKRVRHSPLVNICMRAP